MELLAYSGILNGILVFLIGIFVYYKDKKALKNRLFFLFCLAIVFWQTSYALWQIAGSAESSLIFLRIITVSSVFSSLFFLHLSLSFLNLTEKRSRLLKTLYLITFLLLPVIFSPFYIRGFQSYDFYPYWPKAGLGTNLSVLWGSVLAIIAFGLLFQHYFKLKRGKKNQIGYFILALSILCLAGLLNLPQWYGFALFPYGNFFIFLYPMIIAAATVRYHLFEIKVILTEILVGIMAMFLVSLPFLMPTTFLKTLTFVIFLLFCVFGFLLIKYTHVEISRREKVEKITKKLRKAYKNIEDLSQMKTEFLKVVGHQLRTPVSIIKGLSSMLEDEKLSGKKQRKYIKDLYSSSERLGTILEDILVAQRLVAEKYHIRKEPCDAEALVKEIIDYFKPLAAKKNIKIVFEKPDKKIAKIKIDESAVSKIISRLVDNAILYSQNNEGEEKTITVSLRTTEERKKRFVEISAKDEGIGLDKEDKEQLFTLFYRGKKAVYVRPNGSGLGLFVVKKLTDAHNGKIEFESQGRKKGSTFSVSFPI